MTANEMIGKSIQEIDTPALLVDLDALTRNIRKMAGFFAARPAVLRPHCKTHKCPQIALLQVEHGAVGITCAKTSEAEVFAAAGIQDILIANQITGAVKIDRLTELAKSCNLMVAVDDAQNVADLQATCQAKDVTLRILVEVDIGMGRCGVQPGGETLALAQKIQAASHLQFMGLQAYEGHLVLIKDPVERGQKIATDFAPLQQTVELLESASIPVQIVSGGGTGTYDVSGTSTPLTEIQVGSYVFMDKTYSTVRPEFENAISVLSSIVSRPVPERIVTDAGLKSMTSEFGWPQLLDIEAAKMNYLSEEHGVLTLENPEAVPLEPGEKVQFTPSHVCTTVNLHNWFYIHQNGKVVDVWPIQARGCSQ